MRCSLFFLFAAGCFAQVAPYVEALVTRGDLTDATALTMRYRNQYGTTPEALAAMSWLARGELNLHQYEKAATDAEEVRRLVKSSLALQKLDSNPYLSLALGASYEVEAQCLAAQERRSEALQLLQGAQKEYGASSIQQRLQKNILQLTLVGRPMPAIHGVAAGSWVGKPILLFFWAHWCPDCKAMGPIVAKLANAFEPKGLVVIAPTRYYGYTAEKEFVSQAEEKTVIDQVFQRFYAVIPNAIVPNDKSNFDRYGASTTPTIVVVNPRGLVTLYHPGAMRYEALEEALEAVITHPK